MPEAKMPADPSASPGQPQPPGPSALTRATTDELLRILQAAPSEATLARALRHLAKWRSVLLENTLVHRSGEVVLAGPFAGMIYDQRASEGSRTARLLGAYEASLIPVIETIIARAYPLVIDLGAAEGYYAVGLARRMAGSRIMARDDSPRAQGRCRALALANGVQDRVEVAGRMDHADFAICEAQPTLILCDIEGAEDDLLEPAVAPGLRHADLLVEVHEGETRGLAARLQRRFRDTHRITRIGRQLAPETLPPWTETLGDLDRLLLLWEWRSAPTPWLWMERI